MNVRAIKTRFRDEKYDPDSLSGLLMLANTVWYLRPLTTIIVGKLTTRETFCVLDGARRAHADITRHVSGTWPKRTLSHFIFKRYTIDEIDRLRKADAWHGKQVRFVVPNQWDHHVDNLMRNGKTIDLHIVGRDISNDRWKMAARTLLPLFGGDTRILMIDTRQAGTGSIYDDLRSCGWSGAKIRHMAVLQREGA